jgi:hypothetical protein
MKLPLQLAKSLAAFVNDETSPKASPQRAVCIGMRIFLLGALLAVGTEPVKAQDTEGMVAPHRHGPASLRHLHSDGTAEADNWAGYAIAAATPPATPTSPTGVTVTSVTGSWIVPEAICSGVSSSYSSFWVGIDGWYSPTVEQIGTDSDCSSGTPTYYAWYEFYPLDSYYACAAASGHKSPPCPLMALKVGDVMSAAVNCNTDGTCTATITDESMSPPAPFSTTFTPTKKTGAPQLSSGEWIAETPCCTESGGYLPLTDFGTISYGQHYTDDTGTNFATVITSAAPHGLTAPINSFFSIGPATWWASTMVNENYAIPDCGVNPPPPPPPDVIAAPSRLSADGSSFKVTWKRAGP